MGFNCLEARATLRKQFTFTTQFPEIPGTHFVDLERLSQPRSNPVVLNTGPLDWESSIAIDHGRFILGDLS